MAVKCTNCGGSHPAWDCTKPQTKSTAVRKDVQRHASSERTDAPLQADDQKSVFRGEAGTQALPVDTNFVVGMDMASKDFGATVIGRVLADGKIEIISIAHTPPSKAQFNKSAYQKDYMRDLRKAKPLGITVSEYRKRNNGKP